MNQSWIETTEPSWLNNNLDIVVSDSGEYLFRLPDNVGDFPETPELTLTPPVTLPKPRPFQCPKCGKCYSQQVDLENHTLFHKIGPVECQECLENGCCLCDESPPPGFGELKVFVCQQCGKSFNRKSTLANHVLVHSDDRPFECPECGKCFKRKSELIIHYRVHSGERPFQCTVCNKSFFQKGSLANHSRIHSETRPFRCDQCAKDFKRKGDLASHLRVHSLERPFHCEEPGCVQAFPRKNQLMLHLRTVHSDSRPFVCDQCPKGFKLKGNLISHLRTHSDDRPYKCECCSKAFKRKNNLTEHMAVHDKDQKRLKVNVSSE